MRRTHFEAFAPLCPTCLRHARGRHRLIIAHVLAEQDGDIAAGLLHCSNPACQHEYPIIDGIPIIVPSLGPLLVERGIELMLRTDLDPALESLFGDALGPGSWFDVIRQTVSTYAWDGWADLDPDEHLAKDGIRPGAVRGCLARLLELAGPPHTRHGIPEPTPHSRESANQAPATHHPREAGTQALATHHPGESGNPAPATRHPRESANQAPATRHPRESANQAPATRHPRESGNQVLATPHPRESGTQAPATRHPRESGDPRPPLDPRFRGDDGPARPPAVTAGLDVGCGAGRTTFDLAARHPDALLLGVDLNLSLLRLARQALAGTISYPRRRIGLVYDRRRFAVAPTGARRVDFWACDALALPFAPARADLVAGLNLLDCVAEPARLLAELAAALRSGGHLLLATPYDWSTRATPVETWIGGHSQRADHAGAPEPFLRTLLTEGAHPQSVAGLAVIGEDLDWPWQTRLHDRSSVQYRSHLLALERT